MNNVKISSVTTRKRLLRGVLVVTVWNVVMNVFFGLVVYVFPYLSVPIEQKDAIVRIISGLSALLPFQPFCGWIGDFLLGRYQATTVGLFLSISALLAFLSGNVMLMGQWTTVSYTGVLYLSMVLAITGVGFFYPNSLAFLIEHLHGTDIGAAVRWWYWAVSTGLLVHRLLACPPFVPYVQHTVLKIDFILLPSFLFAIPMMSNLCYRWLFNDATTNSVCQDAINTLDSEEAPILNNFHNNQLLPFAQKGKGNDIKTFSRLFIILLSLFGAFIAINFKGNVHPIQIDIYRIEFEKYTFHGGIILSFDCMGGLPNVFYSFVVVLLIPGYQFIVLRKLHNIPRCGKRVKAGLTFCCIGILLNLSTIGYYSDNGQCILNTVLVPRSTSTVVLFYWLLVSELLIELGCVITLCSSIELIMALCPENMRGAMMGTVLMCIGIAHLIHYGIEQYIKLAMTNCGLYYCVVLVSLLILSYILFTVAVNWYKKNSQVHARGII